MAKTPRSVMKSYRLSPTEEQRLARATSENGVTEGDIIRAGLVAGGVLDTDSLHPKLAVLPHDRRIRSAT